MVFVFYMGAELGNVEQICIGHTAGKSSSEQLAAVAFRLCCLSVLLPPNTILIRLFSLVFCFGSYHRT